MWLGIAFLFLGIFATFLQAWLWSFPMEPDPGGDDPNGKSTAPKFWTLIHRLCGLSFVVIYVVLMIEMVPRLWEYQVELPARTVIHAVMGLVIGILLVAKISIIRWFQHFGGGLPGIGFAILVCTLVLGFLSLPFAIRAHDMVGATLSEENLQRTAERLRDKAEWAEDLDIEKLTSPESLLAGREILATKCVICHDLKTIMDGPKTPNQWYKTCIRMAEKPTFGEPLTEEDIPLVSAYLVAITPDLVRHKFQKKSIKKQQDKVASSLAEKTVVEEEMAYDVEAAAELVEDQCTSCHEMDSVEEYEDKSEEGWRSVVTVMIEEEGVELTPEEAQIVVRYLVETYPEENTPQ